MSASSGDGQRDGENRPHVIDTSAETVSTTELVIRRQTLPTRDRDTSLPSPEASLGIATAEQLNAFRELRTRLLAMAASLNKTHFITLVVGVTKGSGASFVARNLAVAFTLQDQQVAILVDCNLRHPSQHRALGTAAEEGGLFEFLDRPHNAMERLVRPTPIAGLHLIPAGRPPAQPREYFSSQGMRMVIAGLRQAPCYAFLDGPPVKGSPDARILSESADFIVLVAGYGHDTVSSITEAASLFDPNRFAGVVFNERG
jgi:Mrp family chromosome partitioning ATPase